MKIKSKLTVTRGKGNKGTRKGKGHQGTSIQDPWREMMGEGLNVGGQVCRVEESNGGKMRTTLIVQQ